MTTPNISITLSPEWQALSAHHAKMANEHLRALFADDAQRFPRYSVSAAGLWLDYSRSHINDETIRLLCNLAARADLPAKINAMFSGHPINITEKRAVLHTALRDQSHREIRINNTNIVDIIQENLDKMRDLTRKIHQQEWRGATGKPIKHIVNIGIGGSNLGPMMCCQALQDFAVTDLDFQFIATIDRALLNDVIAKVDLESTLFIVSSKTFSTIETMTNARTICKMLTDQLGEHAISHHFIAVTSAQQKAETFGIPKENIFPLWDWVGGRYSVWSAIGLPLMLQIGIENFDAFLVGAHEIDNHFRSAPMENNLPVILALISIWYTNFFGAKAHAIIPYAHRLRHFIAYLQQADMESNGKSVYISGESTSHTTGPIIFGEEGNNGQHAYHQLLHQGTHLIPADFILVGRTCTQDDEHTDVLLASGLSQAEALVRGKSYHEAYYALLNANVPEDEAAQLAHHQVIPGNRPSNIIFMDRITPHHLGALIALYEHKIFVQGVIWNINSFDQWGVELGKQLLPDIIKHLRSSEAAEPHPALSKLIQLIKGEDRS